MSLLWLALALAQGGTVQRVHELEWQRAPVAELAAEAADGPVEVRVAVATALGRLHRDEAAAALEALAVDPDPEVQRAAAVALGWTNGTAPFLRSWLERLPAPTGLAGRVRAEDGVRVQVIEALGRQGDAADLGRLEALLSEPWPTSAAAAEALGRMGRRRVDGAAGALPALVDALERPDPRTVESAAHAIRRIGLKGADASLTARVVALARSTARPQTRAWLVGAALPAIASGARADAFIEAVTDPAPVVRVAALNALEGDDLPVEVVEAWVRSDDAWVRQAAVGALGRMGAVEALQRRVGEVKDPWEVALALEAAGDPLGVDWTDESLPAVVRAAALSVSGLEGPALVEVATGDGPAPLRTAACAVLMEIEEPPEGAAEALLGSPDPVAREAGLELLAKREPGPQAQALLVQLRAEKDYELLGTALVQLETLLADDPRLVDPDDRFLRSAIRRALGSRTARVRRAAEAVAGRVEMELPEPAGADAVRELVLPSGEVVQVEEGTPVLADILKIRGARVETSRGAFTLSLDPETAPMAVANFAGLAAIGFYDNAVVHRVVPGFVAQTGCPRGDGWGGPGWTIPDEPSAVSFEVGSLGMARSSPWDTAGSQWFVSTADTPHLEGDYTRFGEVVQGMHVVRGLQRGDRIESVRLEVLEGP